MGKRGRGRLVSYSRKNGGGAAAPCLARWRTRGGDGETTARRRLLLARMGNRGEGGGGSLAAASPGGAGEQVAQCGCEEGLCFVEFSDPRDADDARHDLDGRRFDGSYIIVEFARGARRGPGGVPLNGRGPPFPGRCYNCGMDGHWVRDCKAGDWRDRCFRCGELGHIERNCKNSPKDLKRGRSYSRSPSHHHGKGRGRSYSRSLSPHQGRGRGRSYSRSPSHYRGRGRSWSYSRSLSPRRNNFKADGEELPPRTSGYSRSPRRSSPPRERA